VQKIRVERKKIVSLRLEGGVEIPIDRLILATGRFVGVGLATNPGVQESRLNLPLLLDGDRVDHLPASRLTDKKNFVDNHGISRLGLRTNRDLMPVDEKGRLIYENLSVAGSLLGGYNPALQGCGMGVAVGTGTLAGQLTAQGEM
jgi:glycerol-3-phosphate dehydrogenase subunit B